MNKHLHASPKLPLTSQHLPHAWAMGGVYVLYCWGVTQMRLLDFREVYITTPIYLVDLSIQNQQPIHDQ